MLAADVAGRIRDAVSTAVLDLAPLLCECIESVESSAAGGDDDANQTATAAAAPSGSAKHNTPNPRRVRRAAARVLRKSRIAPVLAAARKAAVDATERARSAEVALRELTAQADSRAAEAFSGDFW